MNVASQLGLVAALVLLNAAFAGSEIALISLSDGQVRRLEQRSDTGRVVARLVASPNRFLATIQIGITLAGFLASATAAVTLAEPLVEPLGALGGAARPTAIVIVTALLTFVTLVLGELAPKRLAMQRAERWALAAARPLALIATFSRPLVRLLGAATDLVVRLFGGNPDVTREDVSPEDIRDLVQAHRAFTVEQRQVIDGALDAAGRVVRQVMRPRPVVVALPEDMPADDGLAELLQVGRTRAPVYADSIEDAARVVSVMDLVGRHGTVGDHAIAALVLPESVGVVEALRRLQTEHQQMALVVSEYGGIEGVVTVEDIVEEIVGEIYDEYDRDLRAVQRHADGSITVVGHFPVHDLSDLDVQVPDGDYDTVTGLLMERLERIPARGDSVTVGRWRMTVESMEGHRVTRVRFTPDGER